MGKNSHTLPTISEGILTVEMNIPPGRWRDFLDERQNFQFWGRFIFVEYP